MGIGERILKLMQTENLSQKDLANVAGVTEATLSRYINNERQPKAKTLANIATALKTTSEYLLTGESRQNNFAELYQLVARGKTSMSQKEKMELMRLLLEDANK